jgi:hypothetical protein
MYKENTLQMEWCLNCHRNPSKNLRPISQLYNMAWNGPTEAAPVWCGVKTDQAGVASAQQVDCVTKDPTEAGPKLAALQITPPIGNHSSTVADAGGGETKLPGVSYQKFTSQNELGLYLEEQYHIRTPQELSSCETCHR